ncbi:MAG: hypothetical protein GY841_10160, partial [FCB group bacterium]|nr:hypothetical protein [FCB group bacterium]
DFLGEIEAPFGAVGSHTAELIEYWEDRDHDGHFELHVFVDNADPFSNPRIEELEIDDNADGKYERLLRDEEAREYYRKLTTQDSIE